MTTIFLQVTARRYIFQLMKYEHKAVSENSDFDDTNFSAIGPCGIIIP